MVNSVVLDEHRCQGFSYTHSFPGGKVPNYGTTKFNNKIQVGVTLLPDGPRWCLLVHEVRVHTTAVQDKPENVFPVLLAWSTTGILFPQLIMEVYNVHELVVVCSGLGLRSITRCRPTWRSHRTGSLVLLLCTIITMLLSFHAVTLRLSLM